MYRILSLFLICLTLGCASCKSQVPQTQLVKKLPNTNWKSVAVVYVKEGPAGWAGGSATTFAVTDDFLITAGHFCSHAQKAILNNLADPLLGVGIPSESGQPDYAITAEIAAISDNELIDVCLLYSPAHKLVPVKFFNAKNKVSTGAKVSTIGAPKAVFPVTARGTLVNLEAWMIPDRAAHYMFLNIDIDSGNSGSPVFYKRKVIGMIAMKTTPERFNTGAFALHAAEIEDFIRKTLNPKNP